MTEIDELRQTMICRCEDLTRQDILRAIEQGCTTLDEIKRLTRAGMGPCQGRTCRLLIAKELSDYYKIPMEDVPMTVFRPPVKPITMGMLADAYADEAISPAEPTASAKENGTKEASTS